MRYPYIVTPDLADVLPGLASLPTAADPYELLAPGLALRTLFVNLCATGFDLLIHFGRGGAGLPVSRGDAIELPALIGDVYRGGLYCSIANAGVPATAMNAILTLTVDNDG